MARKPTRAAASKKQAAASETSESIAEQTRLFLQSGKKIQVIANGVSGQYTVPGKKQISLGDSRKSQDST